MKPIKERGEYSSLFDLRPDSLAMRRILSIKSVLTWDIQQIQARPHNIYLLSSRQSRQKESQWRRIRWTPLMPQFQPESLSSPNRAASWPTDTLCQFSSDYIINPHWTFLVPWKMRREFINSIDSIIDYNTTQRASRAKEHLSFCTLLSPTQLKVVTGYI